MITASSTAIGWPACSKTFPVQPVKETATMTNRSEEIREAVRDKVRRLAGECQRRSPGGISLGDDDSLTATGLLDSAATIELVLWIESSFLDGREQVDMTAANFGSVNKIAATIEA